MSRSSLDGVSIHAYSNPMPAFSKLFASIIHSTVWRESLETKVVWITMLAMSDAHGRVLSSMPGLADAARVSIELTEIALARLSAPDKYSRTKDFEGRRIEEIDGGWLILNYRKHRDQRNADERREQTRVAVARHREKKRAAEVSQTVSDVSESKQGKPRKAQAEAEAEAEAEITDYSAVGLVEKFVAEHDFGPSANVVAGFIRSQRIPAAVIQTLRMHLAGEMGMQLATARECGLALQLFTASGETTFKPAYFEGFLRKVRGRGAQARETKAIQEHEERRAAELAEASARAALERQEIAEFASRFPASYAELTAQAEAAIDAEYPGTTRGRSMLVKGRLQELVTDSVRRRYQQTSQTTQANQPEAPDAHRP